MRVCISRRRLSANARIVTVFSDSLAYSTRAHATASAINVTIIIALHIHTALNQLLCMNISTQIPKKRRNNTKKMKKNGYASVSAPQHLLLIDIYVFIFVYAPLFLSFSLFFHTFFYSLARNWINSLELLFLCAFWFIFCRSLAHTIWCCDSEHNTVNAGMPTFVWWFQHAILIKMLSKLGFDLEFFVVVVGVFAITIIVIIVIITSLFFSFAFRFRCQDYDRAWLCVCWCSYCCCSTRINTLKVLVIMEMSKKK